MFYIWTAVMFAQLHTIVKTQALPYFSLSWILLNVYFNKAVQK